MRGEANKAQLETLRARAQRSAVGSSFVDRKV